MDRPRLAACPTGSSTRGPSGRAPVLLPEAGDLVLVPGVSPRGRGLWAGSGGRGEQELAVFSCHTSRFRCLWPFPQSKARSQLLKVLFSLLY